MGAREALAKKWTTPYFNQKLKSISFNEVGLRGVKDVKIEFNYPITAIAGANGIGKTTILQLIACLYHNDDNAYKPYRFSNSKKAKSYYTFRDFFIHFKGEDKSEGSEILYEYTTGKANKTHTLKKGKNWSPYNRRPKRVTDFYGVSRVIPAHEFAMIKNTFSSSTATFTSQTLSSSNIETIRGILCKSLTSVDVNSSGRTNFSLNRIHLTDGLAYSNFNMGAGEEVIIALISRISELPDFSIVLIEELELGLHPKAQTLLINSLFEIVFAKKLQLIFTTHSPFLFDAMPKEGRILLKKENEKLNVFYEPSSALAFSELTGKSVKELTVYVEDKIAKGILEELFDSSITRKIDLVEVGSKENIIRMVGAHYRNPLLGLAVGIADGDLTDQELARWYKKYVLKEGEVFDEVFKEQSKKMFTKLPGDNAPEKYILEKLQNDDAFIEAIDKSEAFKSFIKHELSLDDHHKLFYVLAEWLGKNEKSLRVKMVGVGLDRYCGEFLELKEFINKEIE